MTLFEKIAIIGAIIGVGGYFLQILMLVNCPDKYINFQVNLFRTTVISMLIAIISYFISVAMK